MATLSRDGAGAYRAHGIVVRDARHTHNGPEVTGIGAAKNKKRWCRGKTGRTHVLVVQIVVKDTWRPRLIRYCSECGREFDTWYGPPEFNRFLPARFYALPIWVTPQQAAELRAAQDAARKIDHQHRP